ncbi:unnamed protein product [Protopolystoma xenopodis]|uniref:Uncharacterized protein n=1 Tax=Protopolystoma xenopodis TaxID=117903 RepID=A0A448XFP7_9PLAT|nr:unnamed protein product [Protopolystoma xenopodis]
MTLVTIAVRPSSSLARRRPTTLADNTIFSSDKVLTGHSPPPPIRRIQLRNLTTSDETIELPKDLVNQDFSDKRHKFGRAFPHIVANTKSNDNCDPFQTTITEDRSGGSVTVFKSVGFSGQHSEPGPTPQPKNSYSKYHDSRIDDYHSLQRHHSNQQYDQRTLQNQQQQQTQRPGGRALFSPWRLLSSPPTRSYKSHLGNCSDPSPKSYTTNGHLSKRLTPCIPTSASQPIESTRNKTNKMGHPTKPPCPEYLNRKTHPHSSPTTQYPQLIDKNDPPSHKSPKLDRNDMISLPLGHCEQRLAASSQTASTLQIRLSQMTQASPIGSSFEQKVLPKRSPSPPSLVPVSKEGQTTVESSIFPLASQRHLNVSKGSSDVGLHHLVVADIVDIKEGALGKQQKTNVEKTHLLATSSPTTSSPNFSSLYRHHSPLESPPISSSSSSLFGTMIQSNSPQSSTPASAPHILPSKSTAVTPHFDRHTQMGSPRRASLTSTAPAFATPLSSGILNLFCPSLTSEADSGALRLPDSVNGSILQLNNNTEAAVRTAACTQGSVEGCGAGLGAEFGLVEHLRHVKVRFGQSVPDLTKVPRRSALKGSREAR